MNQKAAKGFTLIELVVVIVILGILAAFAAPKFISMEGDARSSSLKGLAGAIKSSQYLVHSLAVVKGQNSNRGRVTIGGTTVRLVNGYPRASRNGVTRALEIDTNDYSVSYGSGRATFSINGYSPSSGQCNVVYTQASSTSTPPTVIVNTGGC